MTRSALHFASLVAVCAANVDAATWEALPPLPEANGGFICAEWDGQVLVLGGTNWLGDAKQWLTGVRCFDPAAGRWHSLPTLAQPLAHALVGSTAEGLIVVGGTTGSAPFTGRLTAEAGRLGATGAPGLKTPAVAAAGGLVGDEMIIVGGTDDVANLAGLRREASAWNWRTGGERALPPYPGGPVGITASVVLGGEVLVFGGASWNGNAQAVVNLFEAYAFSVKRNSWRRLSALPVGVRALAAVVLDANRVYLAGGVQTDGIGFSDETLIYDLANDRYTPARPLPYAAYVGLVRCGDYVYCLGGEDKARHRTATVYRIKVDDLTR